MKTNTKMMSLSLALLAGTAGMLIAGPLNPPAGSVASTYKTLGDVEPRIAINATNTPSGGGLYRITQPGSYYLTGNVTLGGSSIGIVVAASNVTIDLNGFTISGGSRGVEVDGTFVNLTLRNGTVRGTSSTAIYAASTSQARFEKLTVDLAGGTGIFAGSSCVVEGCVLKDGGGIVVGSYSTIRNSIARNTTADGFTMGQGTQVFDCLAHGCVGYGFDITGEGVTLAGCSAQSCTIYGFYATAGSAVFEKCTARANGSQGFNIGDNSTLRDSASFENGAQGALVGARCTVIGSSFRGNGVNSNAAGLYVQGSGNRIEGNDMSSNDFGLWVDGVDNIIIRNTATSHVGAAFTVVAGNEFAPVVTNPGGNNFTTATYFSNFSH